MANKPKYSSQQNKWTLSKTIEVDLRRAIIGGCISGAIILFGSWLVGLASGSEAYHLFKTALPSTQSFCGTISLALGNILALMLTLLSLSSSMNVDIKWSHYKRVRQISWIVTITLITTIVLYLLLNIPIAKTDKTRIEWFIYIYYSLLGISAILGGAFITVVLLLYNTIRDMIGVMDPNAEHKLRDIDEEE